MTVSLNPGAYLLSSGADPSTTDSISLDNGSFTYTGPPHYIVDHTGIVHRYRHTDVPPMAGARLVYNFLELSDTPGSMTLVGSGSGSGTWSEITDTRADGQSGQVLQVVLASSGGGVNNAPQLRGANQTIVYNSVPPLFFPGRIVNYRYDMKMVTSFLGTSKGYFYHRPVDNGTYPTESRPNNFTLPAQGTWVTKHSVMQLNAQMTALGATCAVINSPNDAFTYNLGRPSADIANGTGSSAFLPSEYIPGRSTGPGWRYFTTVNATTRTNGNNHTTAWGVLNFNADVGNDTLAATVQDAVGAAIVGSDPYKGFVQEPAITNLCTADNYLFGIGHGKMSSTGPYTTTPPLQGSVNYGAPSAPAERLRYEVESMPRHPFQGFNAKITFVQGSPDTIVHADGASGSFLTDGWKIGDGIWAWMGNEQVDGTDFVGVVAGVTAGVITLSTNLTIPSRPTATGRRVRLYRIPKVGDQVLLLTNSEGGQFRTTTTSVTRPTYSAVNTNQFQNATDGQKAVVRVGLTAAPTEDGGWVGTDAGVHFFYWTDNTDFGITFSGGTGGAVDVFYDRENMRAAGLDDIAPHGLCFKLSNATGNTTFTFQSGTTVASVDTSVSMFTKKISGGTCTIGLGAHGSLTTFSNTGWARTLYNIQSAGASAYGAAVTLNSGPDVAYILGPQIEQAAVSNSGAAPKPSSPLVNPMKGTGRARTAKRMTQIWGKSSTANGRVSKSYFINNFTVSLDFTPTQVLPNVTQCLWSVGTTTDGFSILLGGASGTTWTARKTIASVNYDSTVTFTPVPGTTHSIVCNWNSASGTVFSVAGNAGSAQSNVADVSNLTQDSPHDLGSLNNTLHCFGALRKTPGAAALVG